VLGRRELNPKMRHEPCNPVPNVKTHRRRPAAERNAGRGYFVGAGAAAFPPSPGLPAPGLAGSALTGAATPGGNCIFGSTLSGRPLVELLDDGQPTRHAPRPSIAITSRSLFMESPLFDRRITVSSGAPVRSPSFEDASGDFIPAPRTVQWSSTPAQWADAASLTGGMGILPVLRAQHWRDASATQWVD